MKRLGFFGLGLALLLSGCVPSTPQPATASFVKHQLPNGATNVVDKGNNWCEFELDGRQFLYHRSIDGANEYAVGYECLTELSSLPAEKPGK